MMGAAFARAGGSPPAGTETLMDPLPTINQNLCTGCHRCVDVCPTQALAQVNGKAFLALPARCTYCTACEDVCPEDAIALPFLIVLAPQVG
jgi:NAD-dependent dihydropyrimidine dehydrogenase PreA subunit